MSILKVTQPNGIVREATPDEENAFIEQVGADHPLSKQILNAREADAKPPVRKPAAGSTKGASSRGGGKKPEAKESDES